MATELSIRPFVIQVRNPAGPAASRQQLFGAAGTAANKAFAAVRISSTGGMCRLFRVPDNAPFGDAPPGEPLLKVIGLDDGQSLEVEVPVGAICDVEIGPLGV